MVCHVDFNVEAIQFSSPLLIAGEINKEAQLPWGKGEGLDKRCDVITFSVSKF